MAELAPRDLRVMGFKSRFGSYETVTQKSLGLVIDYHGMWSMAFYAIVSPRSSNTISGTPEVQALKGSHLDFEFVPHSFRNIMVLQVIKCQIKHPTNETQDGL